MTSAIVGCIFSGIASGFSSSGGTPLVITLVSKYGSAASGLGTGAI